jgi:hypothetical protein
MDFYIVAAWSMFAFISGYVVRALTSNTGSGPRVPFLHRNFEWARRDYHAPKPTTETTLVRLVTDWRDDTRRTMKFPVRGEDGIDRTVEFTNDMVWKFMRCDEVTRDAAGIGHTPYSQLLEVARHNGWLLPVSHNRHCWAPWLGTREKRLNAYNTWRERQQ